MENTNKSIRVRTTNKDTYIPIQLNQDFDFLNVLSLTITQDGVYSVPVANYGVIVGRVTINGGVGVPNAKVNIFIPVDEKDSLNEIINYIYPFKSTSDKTSDGRRYNLLPNSQQHYYHTPVGTFPTRDELVSNPELEYVYKKYYKYTTTTNDSGDYLIMGVPVGEQTIFMDCDISDIGYLSQKPYDLIFQGYGETMFESKNKFKTSITIERLPQIFSQTEVIDVKPFWGDETISDTVGINRKDFDIPYKIEPTAFFIGSMGICENVDGEPVLIEDDCIRSWFTKDDDGDFSARHYQPIRLDQTNPSEGRVEYQLETVDGKIETIKPNGGYVVDENGTWVIQIPMKLGYKTTNEVGELVDGTINNGIPTYSNVRFRISSASSNNGQRITTAAFLCPSSSDYRFDVYDYEEKGISELDPFTSFRFETNKIYTVKSHVLNYLRGSGETMLLCRIDPNSDLNNTNNPFPYNCPIGSYRVGSDGYPDPYGVGFVGDINGYVMFFNFEVNGSSFCNCKVLYQDMGFHYPLNNYTGVVFDRDRNVARTGMIYKTERSGKYYYFNQTFSTTNSSILNLNVLQCNPIEIGEVHPFFDNSTSLPPATSYQQSYFPDVTIRFPDSTTGQHLNKACEIGVDYKDTQDWLTGSITNDDLIQKGQRVLMMYKSGITTGTSIDYNLENESWKELSNLNPASPEYTTYIQSKNSLYYYFGLKRGKTAIDRLVNEYIKI